jgi:phage-related protein
MGHAGSDHGFLKKAQKTPPVEIGRAQRWMQLYKQERGR